MHPRVSPASRGSSPRRLLRSCRRSRHQPSGRRTAPRAPSSSRPRGRLAGGRAPARSLGPAWAGAGEGRPGPVGARAVDLAVPRARARPREGSTHSFYPGLPASLGSRRAVPRARWYRLGRSRTRDGKPGAGDGVRGCVWRGGVGGAREGEAQLGGGGLSTKRVDFK